jgi:methyltransferase (TIGR00027 family)
MNVRMADPLISSVSDTARWVAFYRAQESARPDALFKDELADRLAGERGRAIAAVAPRQARSGWPLVTRTKVIDDLVANALGDGCDRVLNLAAGLDTRPYRLALPAALDWVEADLPGIVEEKERLLAGAVERPVCGLRREPVDLADARARAAFLDRATAGASKVLVITEGLLTYLDDETVRALGRDLLARAAIRWWILDVASPAILQMMIRGMGRHLDQAPMKFAPPDGVAFFEALGWRPLELRSMVKEAVRLRRAPLILRLLSWLPEPDPRKLGSARWSAIVRFTRA